MCWYHVVPVGEISRLAELARDDEQGRRSEATGLFSRLPGGMDSFAFRRRWFNDASNLWEAQKAKGRFFDYEKLMRHLKRTFNAVEIKVYYYTAYPADGTRSYSIDGKHKFLTFLKKGLGFEVRKKELKCIVVVDGYGESIQEKGNMDVEMTIDALHHKSQYDVAVLFTGDSDFLALVTYLRNHGKRVYIFSSRNNVSQELRTGGDGYTDVLTIADDILGRELQRRKPT